MIVRRKRLADGSFGALEKVFNGETAEEKVDRLEGMNAELALALLMKEIQLERVEESQAALTLELLAKGVL